MTIRDTAAATAMPAMAGGLSDDLDDFAGGGVIVEIGPTDNDDELLGVVCFIIT